MKNTLVTPKRRRHSTKHTAVLALLESGDAEGARALIWLGMPRKVREASDRGDLATAVSELEAHHRRLGAR